MHYNSRIFGAQAGFFLFAKIFFEAGNAATGDALFRCAIRMNLVFHETKWGGIVCVRGNFQLPQNFLAMLKPRTMSARHSSLAT